MDIYIFFTNSKILSDNILKKLATAFKEKENKTTEILIFPFEINEISQVKEWIEENIKSLTGTISSFQFRACLDAQSDSKFLVNILDCVKENVRTNYPGAILWTEAIRIFSETLPRNNPLPEDESVFDFEWLISTWNGYVKVNLEDIWNMVIFFYSLELLTGMVISYSFKDFAKKGSFGITALNMPFDLLKEKKAKELAPLLLKEILKEPPEELKNEGEKFWKAQIFDFDSIKTTIRDNVKLDFEEKKKRINLKEGEESKWANILSSVYHFFVIKGIDPYRIMIKENYEKVCGNVFKKFREKIDELIERCINPSSLFSFLLEIYRRTLPDKRRIHTFSITATNVQTLINAVKEKYKNLPFFSSALLRTSVFTLVVSYTIYLLIPMVMKTKPILPLFIGLLFFWFIFFSLLFFLPVYHKRQDFKATVIEAQKIIWQAFDEYIDFEAHKSTLMIFSKLESASGPPEEIEKDPPLFGTEASEYSAIQNYIQKIQLATTINSVSEISSPPFPLISLLEYGIPNVIYEGDINKDKESCVKRGLHKNWRNSTPETIFEKCVSFLLEKLIVQPTTLFEFLNNLKKDLRIELKNKIINWSEPYFLNDALSEKSSFLFTCDKIPEDLLPNGIKNLQTPIKTPAFVTISYEPKKPK